MVQRVIPETPFGETCTTQCPSQCENVFDRVHVSHLTRGGTRVLWDLLPSFADPLPHVFQLQVGPTSNPDADDWEDVGLAMENSFYAIDGEQRVFGKTHYFFYRVQLSTSVGIYYSEPTAGLGVLGRRDWRIAREIVRKEKLLHRLGSQEGYLLKRRWSGVRCSKCLDPQLGESLDPHCEICFGTRFVCGYYFPMPCVWASLPPRTHRKHLDGGQGRGTISDVVVKGRLLMLPLLQEYDVWVSGDLDDRYYVHTLEHAAEMRGVPLIAAAELRPASATDVIFDIEIPQQLEKLFGT